MELLIKLIKDRTLEPSEGIDWLHRFCATVKSQIFTETSWQGIFRGILNSRTEISYDDCYCFLEKMEQQFALLIEQVNWLANIKHIYEENFSSEAADVVKHQKCLLDAQEELLLMVLKKVSKQKDVSVKILELESMKQELQKRQLELFGSLADMPFNTVYSSSETDIKGSEFHQNLLDSPSDKVDPLITIDQSLVDQYNFILSNNEDNYQREKSIREKLGAVKKMSVYKPEAVRSGQDPELTEDSNGSYFCIYKEPCWLVLPVPSTSLKQDHVKSIFDIKNDGDFVESIVREAVFEENQSLLRIKTKGLINAESRHEKT